MPKKTKKKCIKCVLTLEASKVVVMDYSRLKYPSGSLPPYRQLWSLQVDALMNKFYCLDQGDALYVRNWEV